MAFTTSNLPEIQQQQNTVLFKHIMDDRKEMNGYDKYDQHKPCQQQSARSILWVTSLSTTITDQLTSKRSLYKWSNIANHDLNECRAHKGMNDRVQTFHLQQKFWKNLDFGMTYMKHISSLTSSTNYNKIVDSSKPTVCQKRLTLYLITVNKPHSMSWKWMRTSKAKISSHAER